MQTPFLQCQCMMTHPTVLVSDQRFVTLCKKQQICVLANFLKTLKTACSLHFTMQLLIPRRVSFQKGYLWEKHFWLSRKIKLLCLNTKGVWNNMKSTFGHSIQYTDTEPYLHRNSYLNGLICPLFFQPSISILTFLCWLTYSRLKSTRQWNYICLHVILVSIL